MTTPNKMKHAQPTSLQRLIDKDITEEYNRYTMIIECPECGTKNTTDKPIQLGNRYRCGKCGAVITLLQPIDMDVEATPNSLTQEPKNTSGQGTSAVIPKEIEEWNLGAFLLNWLWSIDNNVWIGLLALIPGIGIIMAIMLGMKGNEWAWQHKRWDSIEHFKRTQKKWGTWGFVLTVLAALIVFFIYISMQFY